MLTLLVVQPQPDLGPWVLELEVVEVVLEAMEALPLEVGAVIKAMVGIILVPVEVQEGMEEAILVVVAVVVLI